MKIKIEHYLILIIIWFYPEFSNSYDLIRIMNRHFDMFEIDNNYELLVENNFVEAKLEKGIKYYKITTLGKKAVSDNLSIIIFDSKNKFPEQIDFLTSIFNNFTN